MLEQRLRNRQPGPLKGLVLVLLIVLAALAGSAFFALLEPRLGMLASVLFIAYGCAIAWYLLDWYVLTIVYTANADCLRICRAYGKRERFAADIWLSRVVAWGEPEAMKQRYPGARVLRATRPQCEYEPLALVYRTSDSDAIAVLQPDDAMREHLMGVLQRARRK